MGRCLIYLCTGLGSDDNKYQGFVEVQHKSEERGQAEAEERNRPVKIIRLQFGVGSAWSDVRVHVPSLQRVLDIHENEHANQQN